MRFDAPTKKMLAVVLTALVVLAAVPVAFMVGCNMPMSGTDCLGHSLTIGQVIKQACSGVIVTTHGVEGLAASSMSLLLLVIAAAIALVAMMGMAESRERAYVFVPIAPPPPPEDPLGMRLTL
jgi:hypothetical protein